MCKKNLVSLCLVSSIVFANFVPGSIFAQDTQSTTDQVVQDTSPVFQQEELDQMLAPIALYPDALLSQVLMAATYPLEIVIADRWVSQNKALKGDALAKALENQDWDPSVKSLVNFPSVLHKMSQNPEWTEKLGNAFLAQEQDVMDTIQKLREKAQAAGKLKTSKEQVVSQQDNYIVIAPSNPDIYYVPMYDPYYAYGNWWYPNYRPYNIWGVDNGFYFAGGIIAGLAWGYAWGGFDWHHHYVDYNYYRNSNFNPYIDRSVYAQRYGAGAFGGGVSGTGVLSSTALATSGAVWQHDSSHRRGVAYPNQTTATRFNSLSTQKGIQSGKYLKGQTSTGNLGITGGTGIQSKNINRLNKSGTMSITKSGGVGTTSGITKIQEKGRTHDVLTPDASGTPSGISNIQNKGRIHRTPTTNTIKTDKIFKGNRDKINRTITPKANVIHRTDGVDGSTFSPVAPVITRTPVAPPEVNTPPVVNTPPAVNEAKKGVAEGARAKLNRKGEVIK